MEHDYGRIRTEYEYSDETQEFIRILQCTTCIHSERTENAKDSIKRHLARSHRQMGKVKDLDCPYCKENFKHLGSLNRHIYIGKSCKQIKEIIKKKTWKDVWDDMCNANKAPQNRFLEDIDILLE